MLNQDEVEALLSANPPANLDDFALSVASPPNSDYPPKVCYELKCKKCGGDTFSITAYPLVAPDPSPYYQVASGETIQRPPHSALCAGCGNRAKIFDARKDGYDGILNGGCGYESGEDNEGLIAGPFKLSVLLFYNIELEELREFAAEKNVQPSSLFDFIEIKAMPGEGEPIFFDYKCA